LDWHQLHNDDECFYLRIYGPGDYHWKGADLGVIVTKGRLQTSSRDESSYPLGVRARHSREHAAGDVRGGAPRRG
jgi:hypothetical protein